MPVQSVCIKSNRSQLAHRTRPAKPDTDPALTHSTCMLTGSGSTYRMRKCRAMERQMAPTSQGFDQGGIFSRDWFSDRLDSTGKYVIFFTVYTICCVTLQFSATSSLSWSHKNLHVVVLQTLHSAHSALIHYNHAGCFLQDSTSECVL